MKSRWLMLLMAAAAALAVTRPADYSTDMVMLDGSQVLQSLKLYVSGQKSRVEGFTAGPLGPIVTIARKDRGVTWTLYPNQRQYTETPLSAAAARKARTDLSSLDVGNLKKENLGRETVLGYACTKMRVFLDGMGGKSLTTTVWVADRLDLPIRMEVMGMTQENRNLRVGPQPASLFEIPAGYTKTTAPGRPAGLTTGGASGGGQTGAGTGSTAAGGSKPPHRYDDRIVSTTTAKPPATPAWKLNTNFPGGDYRVIDMNTADPTACKAACDGEAPCKCWTLVKPEEPGGRSYCYLKDSVPEAIAEDCCISGLKGAAGSTTTASTSPYEMNTNRVGEDYRDFEPSKADASACFDACAKDARCRSWTWVKAQVVGGKGHCWLKEAVPEPQTEECCVSGVKR